MNIDCIFKAERSSHECEQLVENIHLADSLSGNSNIVTEYERRLAAYFKTKHAIAVSSGTAALHASLAETINPGDEVLVPAICVPMTVAAVLQAGGVPVFYDCQIDSFKPSIPSVDARRSSKTKVMITVSMWGYPAIDTQIKTYASENNLITIEDTAQGLGTRNRGRYEGTIGDIGCFSTHEFKMISTGEGGFILTDDDRHAENIRSFSHIGFLNTVGSFGYRSGLNYKLSSLQASLGISQLDILNKKMAERRRKIALWKTSILQEMDISFFNENTDFSHNGYSFGCLINEKSHINASGVASELHKRGINTDTHRYKNGIVATYPFVRQFYTMPRYVGRVERDFPNAAHLLSRLLVLPSHDAIKDTDIKMATAVMSIIISGE